MKQSPFEQFKSEVSGLPKSAERQVLTELAIEYEAAAQISDQELRAKQAAKRAKRNSQ